MEIFYYRSSALEQLSSAGPESVPPGPTGEQYLSVYMSLLYVGMSKPSSSWEVQLKIPFSSVNVLSYGLEGSTENIQIL